MSTTRHRPSLPRLAAVLAALIFVAAADAAHATDGAVRARGPLDAPYAHQARGSSPAGVLARFAADHGLRLRIDARASHEASQRWQHKSIDGWLRGESGRDFLERLASAYGFEWFIVDRLLHVTDRANWTTERMTLGELDARAAQTALTAIGLFDARFGWGVLVGQNAVLVSGPRAYVAAVRRHLGTPAPRAVAPQAEPLIFALRYARAGDAAAHEPQAEVRPGVASLLRQLIARETPAAPRQRPLPAPLATAGGAAPPPGPTAPMSWLTSAYPGYDSSSLPSLPLLPSPAGARHAGAALAATPGRSEPVVVADEQTNSVLVWAEPGLRARIERIVETLDQPAPMVSIEVVVLESDDPALNGPKTNHVASDGMRAESADPALYDRWMQAVAERRARLLNRQRVVGFANRHLTLAIGAEAASAPAREPDSEADGNGRAGQRGDSLDVVARPLPERAPGRAALAVDIALVATQPTGLPGQDWSNTSRMSLQTGLALQAGAAPHLIASYPVATARAQQRVVFVYAERL